MLLAGDMNKKAKTLMKVLMSVHWPARIATLRNMKIS